VDDCTFDEVFESAQAKNAQESTGPYLIQASFNFIMRIIDDIEKAETKKKGMQIILKDIPGTQQLCEELLRMNPSLAMEEDEFSHHPRVTAAKELARAKKASRSAKLSEYEVRALTEVVSRFPRNIVLDKKKVNEPKLRLMTRPEVKARLKNHQFCLTTPFNIKNFLGIERRGNCLLDLNDYILRFTPNANRQPLQGIDYSYFEKSDPEDPESFEIVEEARVEADDPFQAPVVSFEARKTN
jgi:hypothetical protein